MRRGCSEAVEGLLSPKVGSFLETSIPFVLEGIVDCEVVKQFPAFSLTPEYEEEISKHIH